MGDLILSSHEIADLLTYDKRDAIDEILSNARKAVSAGQKVIIQETYENAPPQIIKAFMTIEDIDSWEKDIDLLDTIISKRS